MANNELDKNILTSLDAHGSRIGLIPAEVRGFYRRHRDWSQIVLLAIFLGLPWIHIGAYQSVLLDIPKREFALMGVLFKAHEVPLLFFLVAMLALGLAFVTSVWGRIWCGWACPQTVFIEAVYRRIERWVEGTYLERRKLQSTPMNFQKFWKRTLKWSLFFAVSSLIAHSFMAYFVGSKELIRMMQGSPTDNWNYFVTVSFFTAVILFDFGWFREQFCVIMCPYGRFQSVLLEPSSRAIVYDQKRGEPRRNSAAVKAGAPAGDCVSCQRCVQVCPTGIDIRNGLQMECIACTACADACDEIMVKVGKPKHLIGYQTLNNSKFTLKKVKPIAYMILIGLCFVGLIYSLATRKEIDVTLLRGAGLPYTLTTDDQQRPLVINHFRLHINNQTPRDADYEIRLGAEASASQSTLAQGPTQIHLPANGTTTWHFFVRTPAEQFKHRGQIRSKVRLFHSTDSEKPTVEKDLTLLGPQE